MSIENLTSDAAKRIGTYVPPIYNNSSVMLLVYELLGDELDKINNTSGEVALQSFPELSTWGIGYLEDQYGIIPFAGATLEDRRRTLLGFITSRRPMNPTKMQQMINAATGRYAKVNERVAKRTFEVVINTNSGSDVPPLDVEKTKNLINTVKPAHLLYNIFFEAEINITININNEKWRFEYPLCGTKPDINITGAVLNNNLLLDTGIEGYPFEYRSSGNDNTGEYPEINTVGDIEVGSILPNITLTGSVFDYQFCGEVEQDL